MVGFFIASMISIYSPWIASISVTQEAPLLGTWRYLETGTQDGSFCDAVRRSDRRCVRTDDPVREAQAGRWRGFDSPYVFPLAYKGKWKEIVYNSLSDRWTNDSDRYRINSVRAAILNNRSIHRYFDTYEVTINPDVEISSSSSLCR